MGLMSLFGGGQELADIDTEVCQFADSTAGDASQFWLAVEQNGLDATQATVEVGLPLLVLEVADRAHTFDNELCTDRLGKVHGETLINLYVNTRIAAVNLSDGSSTLFGSTHVGLVDVVANHTDNQPVEQRQCPVHNTGVTNGEGVKSAYKYACLQLFLLESVLR